MNAATNHEETKARRCEITCLRVSVPLWPVTASDMFVIGFPIRVETPNRFLVRLNRVVFLRRVPDALHVHIRHESFFEFHVEAIGIHDDPVSYTHLRAHETGRNLV